MDYISLAVSCSVLIISIITLILVLKSKNSNSNAELLSSLNEIEKKQEFTSQSIPAIEGRINESINSISSRQSEEFSALRREMNESQASLRKELNENQASQREEITTLRREVVESSARQNDALTSYSAKQHEEFTSLRKELNENQASQRNELTLANERTLKTVQERLDNIQKTNSESLEAIRANVDEKLNETLTKRLNSSFETVTKQLESVYKSLGEMRELSTGVTNLNKVFLNVKSRGTWAEYQLENILEQTIPGMYERNYKPDKSKGEIVEFAIKIPTQEGKTIYLPVDSKFPVEDYIRVVEASDAVDVEALEKAKKSLETSVINQAKEIKKYIIEPVTTPFAIMYLATEGLYSEVISSKNGIAERCQNEFGIMIAGPSTITALLNSLQVGFRAMKINEKAEEIRQILAVAKAQYSRFTDSLEKVRKNIESAGKSIDDAVKRNEQINKKLKGIEAADESVDILSLPGESPAEE